MADDSAGQIVAATEWPPRHVTPFYSRQRMALRDEEDVAPGELRSYTILSHQVVGDQSQGLQPWQVAVQTYRDWLRDALGAAGIYPVPYSPQVKAAHGWLALDLESWPEFDVNDLFELYARWGDILPWFQCWGQMSNYAGDPELAVPPLLPGEETGCCLDIPYVHTRYLADLPGFADYLTSSGGLFSFYCRPRMDGPEPAPLDDPVEYEGETNLEYLLNWLDRLQAVGANAAYFDTMGGHYLGEPEFVINLFQHEFPADSVMEFVCDVYPTASLMSGALSGGSYPGGPGVTLAMLSEDTPEVSFPRLLRFVLGDRIVFLGESNWDNAFWGPEHDYWTERQAFLYGAKLDVAHPEDSLEEPDVLNHAVAIIVAERERVSWWRASRSTAIRWDSSTRPPVSSCDASWITPARRCW